MMSLHDAAMARREAVRAPADRPTQRRNAADEDAPRHARVSLDAVEVRAKADASAANVIGMASVTEHAYEMYDFFGPYTEVVAADAFDKTLAANPTVEFTLNHNRGGGAPMASTRNGTLALAAVKDGEQTGLSFDANVDTTRTDVADMVKAMQRGDLAEASFKFRIVLGEWSPDFTQFRIQEADINGGDVTAANFGANPAAWSTLREAPAASPKSGTDLVRDADLAGFRSLI